MTSAFDEGEQIRIDDIGMRGCCRAETLSVPFFRSLLKEQVPDRYDEGLYAVVLCLCAPIIPWRQPRLQGETLSRCRHRSSMAAIYTDTEASIWPNGSVRVGFPASHERL